MVHKSFLPLFLLLLAGGSTLFVLKERLPREVILGKKLVEAAEFEQITRGREVIAEIESLQIPGISDRPHKDNPSGSAPPTSCADFVWDKMISPVRSEEHNKNLKFSADALVCSLYEGWFMGTVLGAITTDPAEKAKMACIYSETLLKVLYSIEKTGAACNHRLRSLAGTPLQIEKFCGAEIPMVLKICQKDPPPPSRLDQFLLDWF